MLTPDDLPAHVLRQLERRQPKQRRAPVTGRGKPFGGRGPAYDGAPNPIAVSAIQRGTWRISPRRRRKMVAPSGRQQGNQMSGNGQLEVVGGVAARYWLGENGVSDLVGGCLKLYEPVALPDREQVTQELRFRLTLEIARGVAERTGLIMMPGNSGLTRIEWLVLIGEPTPDVEARLQAFIDPRVIQLPPGVRARDLGPLAIQEMARRLLRRELGPLGKRVPGIPSERVNPQE